MKDSLIKNCEAVGSNGEKGSVVPQSESSQSSSSNKIVKQSQGLQSITGGAVNCLLAVDNVIRATTDDLGTPRKISLSPSTGLGCELEDFENSELLLPLQNTRHLFVREYKKPLKWPIQATRKFQVLNSGGDCIYYAAEKSSFLSKMLFLRGILPFSLSVFSLEGEHVVEIKGWPYFKNCVTIKDSKNQLIGKIKKIRSWWAQSYSIKAWDGTEILNVLGPDCSNCCLFADCGTDDFDVNLGNGTTSIGKISSEWEYALEDLCGVFVPMKLDEMTMSLLLGVVFLIDSNYYQRKRDVSCFGRCFMTFLFFSLFILLLFLIAKK